jgi:hypothetical protein
MASRMILWALFSCLLGVTTAFSRVDPAAAPRFVATRELRPGESPGDHPVRVDRGARGDTADFGYYEVRADGQAYAVRGGTWTWDHGAEDPLEGWTSLDLTTNLSDYWRFMTEAIWLAGDNPLPWPAMHGSGMVLCGARKGEADSLGWVAGIGYGNDWCQRLTSPAFTYNGSGAVPLSFSYFTESEYHYDYAKVFLESGGSRVKINDPGFSGRIGIDTGGVITPVLYTHAVSNTELGGGTQPREFRVVLEFKSDGGLSDEDGQHGWNSLYGAVGVDDVTVGPDNLDPPVASFFDFETGLQGWTATKCPGVGSCFGVASLSDYIIQDPCQCKLSGNIVELHNDDRNHSRWQHEMIVSPIIDRKTDLGDPAYLDYNRVMADFDYYGECGPYVCSDVLYRTGWSYFPWHGPGAPELDLWSPRVGDPAYYCAYAYQPVCGSAQSIGTDWGVPADAQRVRFVYELYVCCDCWSMGAPCTYNFSPIIDNVRVRNVHVAQAPIAAFDLGGRFQDGFSQSANEPVANAPGNSDVAYDLRPADQPARLGDSLSVTGRLPTIHGGFWEARLWWRLKRVGPGQEAVPLYQAWRSAMMAKGIPFYPPAPQFTWGYMDSVEVGTTAYKNRFCSQFRDGPSPGGQNLPADPCFNWGGGGEQAEGNEILPDLCLTPGTKVEYFVTTNYVCTPGADACLPDTTGGTFEEFEILPGYRLDNGVAKYPCVLYVDAFNRGSQTWVENALGTVFYGAAPGAPWPDPPNWDRYDYLDAESSVAASFCRQAGGNVGATLSQLLGYRLIMVDTGAFGPGATRLGDWQGIEGWLASASCCGNVNQQGLIVAGTGASAILDALYPAFLQQRLGAAHLCSPYSLAGCPPGEVENDEQGCVRLESAPGAPYAPAIPVDVFGNWCPYSLPFGVLDAVAGGVGSRRYEKVGSGVTTAYAQVVNDASGLEARYRSVISDFGFHLLTKRDLAAAPDARFECPYDSVSRVTALGDELGQAIRWTLNIADPQEVGLCENPCAPEVCVSDVPGVGSGMLATQLFPNRPNPFNPRTVLRFSLAQECRARLVIYDVAGRDVRTVLDATLGAGRHEVTWDGANDQGQRVGAGVYWSRLVAGDYVSNRKMLTVR